MKKISYGAELLSGKTVGLAAGEIPFGVFPAALFCVFRCEENV